MFFKAELVGTKRFAELGRVDDGEVRLQRLHRRKRAGRNGGLRFAGHLQHDGKRALRSDKRRCVVEAAISSGVFEDQGGMNKFGMREWRKFGGEIHLVKFETGKRVETLPNRFEVVRVYVESENAMGNFWIDLFEAVASGDAEDRHRCGLNPVESTRE